MNSAKNDRSSSLADDKNATEMASMPPTTTTTMTMLAKIDIDDETSTKNDVSNRSLMQTTSFFNPSYEQTFNEKFRRTSLDCYNKVLNSSSKSPLIKVSIKKLNFSYFLIEYLS